MPGRRVILALLACLAASPAFARCEDYVPGQRPQNTAPQDVGREFDRILDEGWIEFALYEDYPPWSYAENGKAAGIDVEIGRLIAEDLGVEPRFRLVGAGENLEADLRNFVWKGAVVNGRVSDVMLHVPYDSAFTCRVEQAVFTGLYAQEHVAIAYSDAEYPDKGPTPPYFRYDTVGVENDSIADFYLTSIGAGADKVHRYRSTPAAMQALAAGEVMAAMGPRAELEAGLQEGLSLHQPPLLGFSRSTWTLGVAVSQQHRDLGYAVDGAIRAAMDDGRLAAVFARFGVTWNPPEW
ncbi:transporter substrate-binding domain-containing protein [Pseudooceanicola sp. 216_PA32_1]|uniref:Transporter substrate-binding domain-containing protein n=1 Tax=Pseudooceanicola pacificus TaxID=2676438 RepID=A0A844WB31_9RHOB|nr:transporter substrate-binding domain-containing protein [Pseudooceanicola pacificus]MWB76430.1 transporter substrate-binding domain-containing protein [Pseudooceanicola pacificus]